VTHLIVSLGFPSHQRLDFSFRECLRDNTGMILRMDFFFLNVETLANLTNPSYANYKCLAIFL
jgi:hypothetical protein